MELDPKYRDAIEELRKLRLEQITVCYVYMTELCTVCMISFTATALYYSNGHCTDLNPQNMGFEEGKAAEALAQFGSVQTAVDALLAGKGAHLAPHWCLVHVPSQDIVSLLVASSPVGSPSSHCT